LGWLPEYTNMSYPNPPPYWRFCLTTFLSLLLILRDVSTTISSLNGTKPDVAKKIKKENGNKEEI
jgi:hypothetical protein